MTPIFITCDPKRDTVAEVKEYVKGWLASRRGIVTRSTRWNNANSFCIIPLRVDFHKDLVGLTGTLEEIGKVAKSYRVYFSKPPKVADGEDYLVDHSIFFYLMSPTGEFVDCYGKDHDADHVTGSVKEHILDYIQKGGKVSKVSK
jgi:protein SCO1/2